MVEKNKSIEALTPKNDYVFKRIFGKVGNEKITKGLVNAVLKEDIKSISLNEETILEKDLYDDKIGILDVKVTIDGDINTDIEMQITNQKDIEKRILFYWSKMYIGGIKEGEEYNKLRRAIVILFCDFDTEAIKNIPKTHTKWNIREEEYSECVLTKDLEIHIINLSKLGKNKEKEEDKKLRAWLNFLTKPEEMRKEDMEEVEEIKLAKEELDKIKMDAREKRLAELREKHIRDTMAIKALRI